MAAPKLRFKEFDNQWDKIKINDQAQTVTSGSRDWAQYYSESGDKFIRMTNLVRDGIYLDLSDLKFVQLPKDSNEGKRTSLKFGDILISITAELGKLGWIPEGLGTAYINQHTALVRMKDSVDSKFIAYSLSTEKYNNKLNSLNDSGAKAGLNLGTIRNFELIVPPKEEQTKIASFLSAVDEKISQLTQKHALLSQYKQGMMQKLFSQQIRFKADDGSEFGEWDYLELNEVLDYEQPTKYIVKSTDYDSSYLTPVLTAGKTFILGYTNETSGIFEGDKENVIIFDDFTTAYKFVNFRFKVKSSAMKILKLNHFQNNIFYIYSVFSLLNLPLGDEHKRRWISEYSKQEIPVPCLEEQTKISNFLSAIDQKIEVVAQQIEQAKHWKKGLLQQMFV
ncbi:restriction endonuclease subunit S [Acinetobacter sp. YH12108]|uniref:restriction endonuclease subunit S n=1 Tax=Acinetobacter sp. YH12108 TaxID=2601095 RepID=UPI0015D2F510|nr:restriction endonuclease subunit S [Acinetobacter sp. YH12108]